MLLRYFFNLTALAYLTIFYNVSDAAFFLKPVYGISHLFRKRTQQTTPGIADSINETPSIPSTSINQEESTPSQSDSIPINYSPNINISRTRPDDVPKLPIKNFSPNNLHDSGKLQGSFNTKL